ncbi:DNA-methyltransferase [Streptomyces sp. CBMA123]|uniref:DNA-methyltransferase n=1 Tax=Streptomyces sp. CBMA123 TaxID=1896313 RepID=UPI0016619791|nr:site-specific DNA-methyltransferase [Streptomyces sp. CBMA123]MBD0694030.1 DNA methylase [Streptomyces sp. CBMA123]
MSYQLHRGDALTVMKTLPDESVDAVITDPPYSSDGPTSRDAPGKSATSSGVHDPKTFPGEKRDHLVWLTELLTEAYRASTEHSVAMIFSDWRQKPDISEALRMAGWTWQGTIPWIKAASQPRKGGFEQSADFITWGVKGTLDTRRDLYLPGHFTATHPGKDQDHTTQEPLEVMQQLVQICPAGGTVLDPFTGTGSTGVAALREGRRFLGIELNPHYADIAEQRLRAELTQHDFVLAGPEA